MNRMINRAISCIAVLVLLMVFGLTGLSALAEARGDHRARLQYGETIEVDGKTYARRPNQTLILMMGVDKYEDYEATGFRRGGQSDFMRLLVIDDAEDKITQLAIDRDTMTEIVVLGILGQRAGTTTAQITLAHAYGDGKEISCELAVEAVSNLFLGAKIDYYIAMNMTGITVLNDWVGGVTVTLEQDFSAFDPAMTEGTTLTLQGKQAEIYTRMRRYVGNGTNSARMERQEAYISTLTQMLLEKVNASRSAIGALYDEMDPWLVTNMGRGTMINIGWAAKDYPRTTVTFPGTHDYSGEFVEFYIDHEAKKEIILSLLYEPLD